MGLLHEDNACQQVINNDLKSTPHNANAESTSCQHRLCTYTLNCCTAALLLLPCVLQPHLAACVRLYNECGLPACRTCCCQEVPQLAGQLPCGREEVVAAAWWRCCCEACQQPCHGAFAAQLQHAMEVVDALQQVGCSTQRECATIAVQQPCMTTALLVLQCPASPTSADAGVSHCLHQACAYCPWSCR
jgi:hypothetical protein